MFNRTYKKGNTYFMNFRHKNKEFYDFLITNFKVYVVGMTCFFQAKYFDLRGFSASFTDGGGGGF